MSKACFKLQNHLKQPHQKQPEPEDCSKFPPCCTGPWKPTFVLEFPDEKRNIFMKLVPNFQNGQKQSHQKQPWRAYFDGHVFRIVGNLEQVLWKHAFS